jgi:DNA-directed RNA polymerase specialized sigma24 family protein
MEALLEACQGDLMNYAYKVLKSEGWLSSLGYRGIEPEDAVATCVEALLRKRRQKGSQWRAGAGSSVKGWVCMVLKSTASNLYRNAGSEKRKGARLEVSLDAPLSDDPDSRTLHELLPAPPPPPPYEALPSIFAWAKGKIPERELAIAQAGGGYSDSRTPQRLIEAWEREVIAPPPPRERDPARRWAAAKKAAKRFAMEEQVG